jgi:hypothetical protein
LPPRGSVPRGWHFPQVSNFALRYKPGRITVFVEDSAYTVTKLSASEGEIVCLFFAEYAEE